MLNDAGRIDDVSVFYAFIERFYWQLDTKLA